MAGHPPSDIDEYLNRRFRNQALISLTHAFKTIDAFAHPYLDPEDSKSYENIKNQLIETYSKGTNLDNGELPIFEQ